MQENFEYPLKNSINIAKDSQQIEAKNITIPKANRLMLGDFMDLRSLTSKVIYDAESTEALEKLSQINQKNQTTEEKQGEEISQKEALKALLSFNFVVSSYARKAMESFEKYLLKYGRCEDIKITEVMLNKINIEDLQDMYIAYAGDNILSVGESQKGN